MRNERRRRPSRAFLLPFFCMPLCANLRTNSYWRGPSLSVDHEKMGNRDSGAVRLQLDGRWLSRSIADFADFLFPFMQGHVPRVSFRVAIVLAQQKKN